MFKTLFTALVTAGCVFNVLSAQAASNLVYCSEGSPAGFDPGLYTAGTDHDAAASTLFNRLADFERGGTKAIPSLAERWDISEDGKTYTFFLRQGVNFHTTDYFKPTRPFNADDVLFTFQRMLDKEHPFRKAYPSEFPYFTGMSLDKNIARVEKVDEHTVRFMLNERDAAFVQNLAMRFAGIHSAEYADQLLKQDKAEQINQKPIGTGPFVFSRYQKDAMIRFKGNKDYWQPGQVKLDNLIFSINTDSAVRAQKLRTGECHVSVYPNPADIASLEKDPNLKVMSSPGYNIGYLGYNVQHPPLDKLEVRQALDMAINKQNIIEAVFQGAGQLAVNGMPPSQWSYNETIKDLPRDPVKAKELLKQAGVKEGTKITLWAMPVQRPYNPNARLMAQMIQNDWAKIGINAEIVTYEWGEYLKRAKSGQQDTILVGWTGDNGDPDNWLGTLYGCDAIGSNNYSMWCDKTYDDLVKNGKRVSDQAERTEFYRQAQVRMKEQIPNTPIAHSTAFMPMRKNVQGYVMSPLGHNAFVGVSVD